MLAGALSVAAAFMLMVTLGLTVAWYYRYRRAGALVYAAWAALGTACGLVTCAALAAAGLL